MGISIWMMVLAMVSQLAILGVGKRSLPHIKKLEKHLHSKSDFSPLDFVTDSDSGMSGGFLSPGIALSVLVPGCGYLGARNRQRSMLTCFGW